MYAFQPAAVVVTEGRTRSGARAVVDAVASALAVDTQRTSPPAILHVSVHLLVVVEGR